MASKKNLFSIFTDIANAIRNKKGTTEELKPYDMADEINSISTEGSIEGVTLEDEDLTVDSNYVVKIQNAYDVYLNADELSTFVNGIDNSIQVRGTAFVGLNGDSAQVTAVNLSPENIKKDVNILGVVGTHEGGSVGSAIEVATAEEMDAVLIAENIGKIYQYVGTTDETYTNGKLYRVVEEG